MRFFLLLLSLFTIETMAMSAKPQKIEKLSGTTLGTYQKPGAPVNMTYTSEHPQVGQTAMVEIDLITSQASGKMRVSIHPDDTLESVGEFTPRVIFNLRADQTHYPIKLQVRSQKEGRHYIRLMVKMDKSGFRAFAIPVNIGTVDTLQQKPTSTTPHTQQLHISPAEETITKP